MFTVVLTDLRALFGIWTQRTDGYRRLARELESHHGAEVFARLQPCIDFYLRRRVMLEPTTEVASLLRHPARRTIVLDQTYYRYPRLADLFEANCERLGTYRTLPNPQLEPVLVEPFEWKTLMAVRAGRPEADLYREFHIYEVQGPLTPPPSWTAPAPLRKHR